MNTPYLRERDTKNRSGFALFLVLILGVAGMLLLFTLYTGALDPFTVFHGSEADRYSDPNAYPWEEGHLFIKKQLDGYNMGGRRPPFRAQPKIDNKLHYKAEVYDGDEQRGQIALIIRKDGDALSGWSGDFRIKGKRYTTVKGANSFEGNIAPLKVYEDEDGKDRSKLYVITQGFFHLQELKEDKSFSGIAYVTGWIDRDYNAEGKLSIPSFINGELTVFNWGPVTPSE